jgi:AhpD family alkylhydroperoxidase
MATAPALLKAYTALSELFDQTSLSATERQVVLLAVSAENNCEYCVAAHTAIAGMQKVPPDVVGAIRGGGMIADPKLEALRQFAVATVKSRGFPSTEETRSFFLAGYGEAQVLEVVLGIGMKTLSNYTNHIARTRLDEAFAPVAWSRTI